VQSSHNQTLVPKTAADAMRSRRRKRNSREQEGSNCNQLAGHTARAQSCKHRGAIRAPCAEQLLWLRARSKERRAQCAALRRNAGMIFCKPGPGARPSAMRSKDRCLAGGCAGDLATAPPRGSGDGTVGRKLRGKLRNDRGRRRGAKAGGEPA